MGGKGKADWQRSEGGILGILPHAFRVDRSRLIYPHDRFPPRSMVLASFAFTSLMLAEDTTSDVLIVHHQSHGWQRIPRHQSYKADRLSWRAALPLCRATTTCHGLSPAFVKEEERYFFPRRTDTSPAVSSSEAYGRRAMSF